MNDEETNTSINGKLAKVDDSHLVETANNLVKDIINEDDPQRLQELYDKFNISQSKKDFLSSLVYKETVDKTVERVLERVDKYSDNLSTKDLLDVIRVMSDERIKASKSFTPDPSKPLIQVNNIRNDVSIHDGSVPLSRESKERVLDVIKAILGEDSIQQSSDVLDLTEEESKDNIYQDQGDKND